MIKPTIAHVSFLLFCSKETLGAGLFTDRDFFYFSTGEMEQELLSIKTLQSFESFVEKNEEAFTNSYVKLLDFIDSYISVNTVGSQEKFCTLNAFLKKRIENPAIVAGFNTMISKLRCYGIIPSRINLSAIGIHFGMTSDDISTMLCFAGMEPICAKDKLESVLIFAIEYAIIQNPDMEFSNTFLLKQYTKNPDMKEKCDEIIRKFEMAEYRFDNNTDLYEYIIDALFHFDSHITDEMLYLLGENNSSKKV